MGLSACVIPQTDFSGAQQEGLERSNEPNREDVEKISE